jgi:hypothetical protein
LLDRRITSISTSKKCFIVNKFIEEENLEGRKMVSTGFGSNCPSRIQMTKFKFHDSKSIITFLNKGELTLSCRRPHQWIPKDTSPQHLGMTWIQFEWMEKWLNYVYFLYSLPLTLGKAKGPPQHCSRMLWSYLIVYSFLLDDFHSI